MAKFKSEINVEPADIPRLDNAHKRDCLNALEGIINHSFKYTLIMTLGIMAFFGVYTFFSVIFLLRMERTLPQVFALLPLAALVAFLLEFVAGAMHKWALITEVLLNILIAVTAAVRWPSVWIVPFALYGAFVHIKLLTLLPIYRVLSAQKGYPEFIDLPAKDEIMKPENQGDKR